VILKQRSSLIQNQFVRWKGHNKWGNIKATKGAKDLAFATLSSRYAMNISIAIKEHGNVTDPERNKSLAKYVLNFTKGQVILECLFDVLNFPKQEQKI
jgi:hypothetical protein